MERSLSQDWGSCEYCWINNSYWGEKDQCTNSLTG